MYTKNDLKLMEEEATMIKRNLQQSIEKCKERLTEDYYAWSYETTADEWGTQRYIHNKDDWKYVFYESWSDHNGRRVTIGDCYRYINLELWESRLSAFDRKKLLQNQYYVDVVCNNYLFDILKSDDFKIVYIKTKNYTERSVIYVLCHGFDLYNYDDCNEDLSGNPIGVYVSKFYARPKTY